MRQAKQRKPERGFEKSEVDAFAQELQCPEEMDVCSEDVVDTKDSISGVVQQDFAVLAIDNERYRSNPLYFTSRQPFLTPIMRAILFDWMMEVASTFHLRRETYYLALVSVDRYLSITSNVRKEEYQLVGLAALYIAAKAEEVSVPKLCEFAQSADNGFQLADIKRMERCLLSSLKWRLFVGTPCETLNWLTWKWDEFMGEGINSDVLFHEETPEAYKHYRELFQVMDLAYLDVGVLMYPSRILAMGLLYIMVSRFFQESVLQGDLACIDMLQQQSQQIEALFSNFIQETELVGSLKELFPVLDFLYGFLDMLFCTEPWPCGFIEHNESFLSCQTHNPHNVKFITNKFRIQG